MNNQHKLNSQIQKYSQNIFGVTLVETTVTILVFIAIVSGIFAFMSSGSDSRQIDSVKEQLHEELKKSRRWLTNDIEQASVSSIANFAVGTSQNYIEFKIPIGFEGEVIMWSEVITYYLAGANNDELRRAGPDIGGASLRRKHEELFIEIFELASFFHVRDAQAQGNDMGNLGDKGKIIATNINSLTFTRPTADSIDVSLTVKKMTDRGRAITQNMDFRIQLINSTI